MTENILVFKPDLVPNLSRTTFTTNTSVLSSILSVAEFLERDKMEHNTCYKQIIPYSLMRYKDKILSYQRSGRTDESRLRQLYSIGVGGHINESDILPLLGGIESPIDLARDREVFEEFHVELKGKPHLVGLLNDESNDVGLVHLGIIYEYWLSSDNCWPKERGNFLDYRLLLLEEMLSTLDSYESWSQIVLVEYLKKQQL